MVGRPVDNLNQQQAQEHYQQEQKTAAQRMVQLLERINAWMQGKSVAAAAPEAQPADPGQPTAGPGEAIQRRTGAGLTGALNQLLGSVGQKMGIEGIGPAREQEKEAKEKFEKDKTSFQKVTDELKKLADSLNSVTQQIGESERTLREAEQAGADPLTLRMRQEHLEGLETQRQGIEWKQQSMRGRQKEAMEAAQESRKALSDAQEKVKEYGGSKVKVDWTKMVDRGGALQQYAKNAGLLQEGGGVDRALTSVKNIATNIPRAMAGDPTAIAQIGVEAVKMHVENFQAIGQHVRNVGRAGDAFMRSERAEDLFGTASSGGKSAAKAAGRALGGPIGGAVLETMIDANPFIKLSEAVVGAVGKLREWGDQLHQANMRFAEFSASMAGVQARQEQREFQLNRQRGGRRAASAEYLAEGKQGLDTKLSVIEDAAAILKNRIVGGLDRLATFALTATPVIGPFMQWLEKVLGGGEPEGLDVWRQQAQQYADMMQERQRRAGRPPGRFPGFDDRGRI